MLRSLSLACLLALGACAFRTGPVVGDWRGLEETISDYYDAHVELILDGQPGATSGTYHYTRLLQEDMAPPGGRFTLWTDHWDMRTISVDGRDLPLIHLHNLPDAWIANFVRTDGNVLVPVPTPHHPDLSPAAFQWALRPIPRTAYGYGRP